MTGLQLQSRPVLPNQQPRTKEALPFGLQSGNVRLTRDHDKLPPFPGEFPTSAAKPLALPVRRGVELPSYRRLILAVPDLFECRPTQMNRRPNSGFIDGASLARQRSIPRLPGGVGPKAGSQVCTSTVSSRPPGRQLTSAPASSAATRAVEIWPVYPKQRMTPLEMQTICLHINGRGGFSRASISSQPDSRSPAHQPRRTGIGCGRSAERTEPEIMNKCIDCGP